MKLTESRPSAPALELRNVCAGYGGAEVLHDVSLAVGRGEVVALLGPNGAGKTTLLRTASGLLRSQAGAIWCGGEDVTREAPHVRARRGLCLIPDGRGIFRNLSVRDNIRLQARPGDHKQAIEHAVETFPVLKHRLGELAGRLSGGQQQMLALTRAYVTSPSVVLLDEVSMGLAPKAIDLIFDSLRKLSATGMSMLLVEQYVERALEVAHRVAVLDRGVISLEEARDKIASADIAKQYFAT